MALVFGQATYIHNIPITSASPADGDTLVYSTAQNMWVSAGSGYVVERDDTDCGHFFETVSEITDLGSFV